VISTLFHRWFNRSSTVPLSTVQTQTTTTEAETQFQRGLMFACGEGETQDYAEAARWYGQAAEQDHPLAQFNLAVMYAQGQGVARDGAKSLLWMKRAAELGDAGAQYRLGMCQHLACRQAKEAASPEQRIEAFKWVRLSAAQGYRGAAGACEFMVPGMTREEVAESGRRVDGFSPPAN
jgi:TPR repeat protein